MQNTFVIPTRPDQRRALLRVAGMNCAACCWLLEHYLMKQPGVVSVSAHLAERRLNIDFDPTQTLLSQLMSHIFRLGYQPLPFDTLEQDHAIRRENQMYLRRLGVAGLVMMQLGMFAIGLYAGAFQGIEVTYWELLRWASLVLAVPVVGYAATPFFAGAWRGLRVGHSGMDLPVALAIGIAFVFSALNTVRGHGEIYFDSLSMFTFFLLLARFLEQRSRRRLDLSSSGLLSILPRVATRLTKDANSESVALSELRPGDRILVRAGETFPADSVILAGRGGVDESSVSGESLPVSLGPGDTVSAGSLSTDGVFELKVLATGLKSQLGSILSLLDRAVAEKPRVAELADRVAAKFVLTVLAIAAATAIYWGVHRPEQLLASVLSVLVVSCPCALSLATPASLAGAAYSLRRLGFLITRGHAIETLALADCAVFDKTGTLTYAEFRLAEIQPIGNTDRESALGLATALESRSEHPLAKAFEAPGRPEIMPDSIRVEPGRGIEAKIEAVTYRIGEPHFVAELSPGTVSELPGPGKWILLGSEGGPLAWFRLTDTLRDSAKSAVEEMRQLGLRVVIMSGDSEPEVNRIAHALGIERYHAGMRPDAKHQALRDMQQRRQKLLVVGDGINDLPILAAADVSVAVANAADISKAEADCLLLNSDLRCLAKAISIARRTRRVIAQNLAWAVLYNLFAIPLAAAGSIPPWLAAIGMSLSSVLVVGNAGRLARSSVRKVHSIAA